MTKNIRNIDPQLLETLVVIEETGSFAAAADRVGRSRSAITMQMHRLEDLLQLQLFEPKGRTRALTPAGEILLSHAKIMLRLNDEFWDKLAKTNEPAIIRFGAPDDYMDRLLPRVIERFSQAHPGVIIEFTCEPSESLKNRFERGKLDLALVTKRSVDEDEAMTVRREPLVWVSAPNTRFSDDAPLPLSVFQPGCVARSRILDACADHGLDIRISYSSPSLSGLLSPVRAGVAVTAIARCSVPEDLVEFDRRGGMPQIEPLDLGLLRNRQSTATPYLRGLIQELQAGLQQEATHGCL